MGVAQGERWSPVVTGMGNCSWQEKSWEWAGASKCTQIPGLWKWLMCSREWSSWDHICPASGRTGSQPGPGSGGYIQGASGMPGSRCWERWSRGSEWREVDEPTQSSALKCGQEKMQTRLPHHFASPLTPNQGPSCVGNILVPTGLLDQDLPRKYITRITEWRLSEKLYVRD